MTGLRMEVLLPLLFPLLWVAVCTTIASFAGWQALAGSYRAQYPFEGARWVGQSATLRWGMGYHGNLTVGADAAGLRLSVLFLFRPGHPPLFIPWQDVSVESRRVLFGRRCRLQFRQAGGVSLTINQALADKLRTAAGGAWPQER